uniref:Uncharacterized protein n=1 Tax=Geospiza parvula TaxID=87175 RepID=A0A8C3N1B0_GEOPR
RAAGICRMDGSGGFWDPSRRARWRVPVIPAAGEAEPDGSLEPRSSGLPCAVPSGRPS